MVTNCAAGQLGQLGLIELAVAAFGASTALFIVAFRDLGRSRRDRRLLRVKIEHYQALVQRGELDGDDVKAMLEFLGAKEAD